MDRYTITAYVRCYQDPELFLKCVSNLLWVDEILIADNSSGKSIENVVGQIHHHNLKYCRTAIIDWRLRIMDLKKEVSSDYILMVDTDEYYTNESSIEILKVLSDKENAKEGYIIPSESYLYCEYFAKGADQLRLFKKDKFFIEFKSVHEMPRVLGPVELLKHGYNHYNSPTLSSQISKVLGYELNDAELLDDDSLQLKRTDKMSEFQLKKHFFIFILKLIWRSKIIFFTRNITIVHLWMRYLDICYLVAHDITPTEEIRRREGKKY